jgi:hypothetical protein
MPRKKKLKRGRPRKAKRGRPRKKVAAPKKKSKRGRPKKIVPDLYGFLLMLSERVLILEKLIDESQLPKKSVPSSEPKVKSSPLPKVKASSLPKAAADKSEEE